MECSVVLKKHLPRVFLRLFVVLLSATGVKCLTVNLDRATARTLLIDVTSGSTCRELTWEYRSSIDKPWGSPPMLRDHLFNPCAFYIARLEINTQHYVRVRQGANETYSNELSAWTCQKKLSTVKMHVADAGAGWIDVRWELPQEKCSSHYYYHVRYKSANASYTADKVYGYVELSKSQAFVGPSHPCASPAKEFCLLLTDHVQPGRNYTIELQIERIGGEAGEISDKQWIEAYADPENFGAANNVSCKVQDSGYVVTMPLWVVAVSGSIYFIVLLTIFGLWVKLRFSKVNDKARELERQQGTPFYSKEERYVNPNDMRFSAISKNIEVCDEEIYEEVFFPHKTE